MENKLLISATYREPITKWVSVLLIVIGIALPILTVLIIFGDFSGVLNYEGNILARILDDEDGVIYLAIIALVIVCVPIFLSMRISIRVYESHIMCKWASFRKATRVEYNQIASVEIGKLSDDTFHGGFAGALLSAISTLDIKLGESNRGPKKISYIVGSKKSQLSKEKAQQIRDIILEKKSLGKRSS